MVVSVLKWQLFRSIKNDEFVAGLLPSDTLFYSYD